LSEYFISVFLDGSRFNITAMSFAISALVISLSGRIVLSGYPSIIPFDRSDIMLSLAQWLEMSEKSAESGFYVTMGLGVAAGVAVDEGTVDDEPGFMLGTGTIGPPVLGKVTGESFGPAEFEFTIRVITALLWMLGPTDNWLLKSKSFLLPEEL